MHSVGIGGKDLRDHAGSAPRNDVLGSSSGALDLGVGGWHVDFYAFINDEVGRNAMFVKAFCYCCLNIGVVIEMKLSGGRRRSKCGECQRRQ